MLRFHEIAEGSHRILNPFTPAKYDLLAGLADVQKGGCILDIACGKGEMLCQWSQRFGITGIGVDISKVFLAAAHARAAERGVDDRVRFIESDGAEYLKSVTPDFDIVCCIGATWIGNGLTGTIDLLKPALKNSQSLLLIGEPFYIDPPPPDAVKALAEAADDMFTTLAGTLDRFEAAGLELLEMLIADHDDWDRYEASQWKSVFTWLDAHPDDPDAPALSQWIETNRRNYLTWGRRYLGWGVFVLKLKP